MLDSYIRKWIEEATTFLMDKVKAQTPEDTWELQSNNKTQPITESWWIISWWLINDTPYWPYVEYWVNWKAYNYYKNGWRRSWWSPFFKWWDFNGMLWARMFTKSQFENQSKVRDILMKYINQWIKDFNSKKK